MDNPLLDFLPPTLSIAWLELFNKWLKLKDLKQNDCCFRLEEYLLRVSKKLKLNAEFLSHLSLLKSLDVPPKNVDLSSESDQFRFYIYLSIYMLL